MECTECNVSIKWDSPLVTLSTCDAAIGEEGVLEFCSSKCRGDWKTEAVLIRVMKEYTLKEQRTWKC